MTQITITYDSEDKKMTIDNAVPAEVIIMLNDALKDFCSKLEMPIDQAITIAYSMQEKGELWDGTKWHKYDIPLIEK